MACPHARQRWILALALLAPACGATPNRSMGNRSMGPQARVQDSGAGAEQPQTQVQQPDARPREAAAEGANRSRVLATVAGDSIRMDDLVEDWVLRDGPGARQALEDLVLVRLTVAESKRLGIELDPSHLESAMQATRASLEEENARAGAGLTLEETIERRLGLDPALYLSRLEERRQSELLTQRCVRAWILASERVDVRVIVVADEDAMQKVQAELVAGAEFVELARTHSREDSAAVGGRIPPVVRGNTALARLAFSTPVGEVGGPLLEQGQYLFLYAEARPAPIEGPWSEIGPLIEASLAEHPVESPEFWQWKGSLLDRFEVDMTPFLELTGLGAGANAAQ
ncbi:MAG: hypothetical protein GY711_14290 [bacterium]|nr:hypothetical protein [bacterium]